MTRDETRFSPNVGSLYSFVETSGWTVTPTQCTYYVKGGITSGYYWNFTGYSQLEWWESGTWHNLASEKSGTYGGYGDKVYDSMNDAFDRHYNNRTVRVGNYAHAYVNGQSTSAEAYIEYIVPALPPNATTITATRNSDTSATLAWTEAAGVKESVRIERSIDGSSFAEIAAVSGSATSYTDSSTASDHTYTYRIRYYNQNAYGAYSSTSSVTMSPAAPTAISVARDTATNVAVTLTNTSSVATSIQWQVTYDGGSTWSASTSVSGSPVTSFVASTNGGTVKIRVRNVNDTGSSAWIVSDSVVTLVPPAPPTLITPSGIVNLAYSRLVFEWKHNPLDGSAQTAAILQYTVGNTSAQVPIGTENTYTLDIQGVAAGSNYSWKVKTKGADPSYSDWSSTFSGKLYAEPQIYFIAQNPPSTVTALPIPIEVGYSDPQFKPCASAVMTIKRDGRTVYTEPLTIGSSRLTGQITAAELLPEQGATYTVSVTARSGSTLEATTNTTFTVDYVPPTHGTVQVQNEPETGYASLLATFDNHASDRSYSGNTNSAITVDGAAVRSMTVDGKSVQDGTPSPSAPVPIQVVGGANLLDKTGITAGTNVVVTQVSNGVNVAATNSQTYRMANVLISSLGLVNGASYIITADATVNSGAARIAIRNNASSNIVSTSTYTSSSQMSLAFTYDSSTMYELCFFCTYGTAAYGNVSYRDIMLCAGSTAMPYVPYGSLGLKVSGKNLLPDSDSMESWNYTASLVGITDGVATIQGTSNTWSSMLSSGKMSTKLLDGTTYYTWTFYYRSTADFNLNLFMSGTAESVDSESWTRTKYGSYRSVFTVPSSGGEWQRYTLSARTLSESQFTSGSGEVNSWFLQMYVRSDVTIDTMHWQFEVGSTATDYTPYVDSLTEIPLAGHVLASLPDGTKDVMTIDASGHCVIEKNIAYTNYNGGSSEDWRTVSAGTNYYNHERSCKPSGGNANPNNVQAMSERYPFVGSYTSASSVENGLTIGASGGITNIVFGVVSSYATLDDWTTALAADPLRVVFPLATPTTVDLGYITMPELEDGCTVEILSSLSTPLEMVTYDGLADAESISVIRVNRDGSRTQLADHAANYIAIIDKYAPLNTDYTYEVVTYAASGAYAVEITPNLLESTRWFAYWGENNIAWAQWNPSGSYTLSRPEKKRVHYAGRKWPVSYDSKAIEQSHSMTWTVVDMDDWQNGFIDLMNDGGRGVYKGCDGWVFHADFEYSATPQYTSITRMGDMSLTISRIDGEQL